MPEDENTASKDDTTHKSLDFGPPKVIIRRAETPVLHRVISSRVYRPLWDYRSDAELLQGLLAALDAHKFLWKRQILHRDISAGNILLAENPEDLGTAGFLNDIEFAHMPPNAELSTLEYVPPVTKYDDKFRPVGITESATRRRTTFETQCGAALTGTLQFMAIDVLEAALAKRSVEHTPEHDVESFIWVLGYCILRNLYNKAYAIKKAGPEYISIKASFTEAFGSLSLIGILSSRRAAKCFNWCSKKFSGPMEPFFEEHISDPLRRLLRAFQSYVGQRQVEEDEEEYRRDGLVSVGPLTHDMLRRWITGAITRLQEDPSRDRSH